MDRSLTVLDIMRMREDQTYQLSFWKAAHGLPRTEKEVGR